MAYSSLRDYDMATLRTEAELNAQGKSLRDIDPGVFDNYYPMAPGVVRTAPDPKTGFLRNAELEAKSQLRNMAATGHAAMGGVAEQMGANDFAAARYADMNKWARKAAEDPARVNSYKDIENSDDLRDYIGKQAGGLVSSIPTMIAGAVAARYTKGRSPLAQYAAPLLAGTVATMPQEYGGLVQDYKTETNGAAIDSETQQKMLLAGGLSSGLQSVVPSLVGASLARGVVKPVAQGLTKPAATSLLRNVGSGIVKGAAEESFFETSADALKSKIMYPDRPLDVERLKETAVASAVGGGLMGGVGGVGNYAHGRMDQAQYALGKAGEIVGKATDKTVQLGGEALGAVKQKAADLASGAAPYAEQPSGSFKERRDTLNEWHSSMKEAEDTPAELKVWLQEEYEAVKGNVTNPRFVAAVSAAREYVKGARTASVGAVKGGFDRIDGAMRGRDADDVDAETIAAGRPLGDQKAFAEAPPEVAAQLYEANKEATASKVAGWIDSLSRRANLNEETREKLARAAENIGDKATQQWVAAKQRAARASDKFADKLDELHSRYFNTGGGFKSPDLRNADKSDVTDVVDIGPGKKSEDYSGADAAVREVLLPWLQQKHSYLFEGTTDADAEIYKLGSSLRSVMLSFQRGKPMADEDVLTLRAILGSDAVKVMTGVLHAAGDTDPAKVENFWRQLNGVHRRVSDLGKLQQAVMVNLDEAVAAKYTAVEVQDAVEVLTSWARGDLAQGVGPEAQRAVDAQVHNFVEKLTGGDQSKADAIMTAVEGYVTAAAPGRPAADKAMAGMDAAYNEGTEYEAGPPPEADEKHTFVGGGNGNTMVKDPALTRREGFESSTEKTMKRLEAENPGSMVRFVSYAADPELVEQSPMFQAAVKGLGGAQLEARIAQMREQGEGVIVLTDTVTPERIDRQFLKAVRLESKGNARSPSRLQFGEFIADAAKITRQMDRTLPYDASDDISSAHRKGRAFMAGYAELAREFGAAPELSKDLVIANLGGGKTLTVGDIERLGFRPGGSGVDTPLERARTKDGKEVFVPGRAQEFSEAPDISYASDRWLKQREVELVDLFNDAAAEVKAVKKLPDTTGRVQEVKAAQDYIKQVVDEYHRVAQEIARRNGEGYFPEVKGSKRPADGRTYAQLEAYSQAKAELEGLQGTHGSQQDIKAAEAKLESITNSIADGVLKGTTKGASETPISITPVVDISTKKGADRYDKLTRRPPADSMPVEGATEVGKADADIVTAAAALGEGANLQKNVDADGVVRKVSNRSEPKLPDDAPLNKKIALAVDQYGVSPQAAMAEVMSKSEAEPIRKLGERLAYVVKNEKLLSPEGTKKLNSLTSFPPSVAERRAFVDTVKSLVLEMKEAEKQGTEKQPPVKQAANPSKLSNDEVDRITVQEDYNPLTTPEAALAYLSRARERYAELKAERKEADREWSKREYEGDDPFTPDQYQALADYDTMFGKNANVDLEMFVSETDGFYDLPEAQQKALKAKARSYATPEVVAQGPKGQPAPKAVSGEVEARKVRFLDRASKADPALEQEINQATDPKKLQRAVTALNEHLNGKPANEHQRRIIDAANERIAELVNDDLSMQYGMATGLYSLGATNPTAKSTPQSRQEVRQYIEQVLGKSVRTAFQKMAHAGEYIHSTKFGESVIRVSTLALNPMGTAYHESLHAFFGQLRDVGLHEVQKVLFKASNSVYVRKQLTDYFKDQPDVLKQIANSAEERVAYMYQLHMMGVLDLKGQPKTLMTKIADAFKQILGIWTNDERALHIMEYFSSGEYARTGMGNPNAIAKALVQSGRNSKVDTLARIIKPVAKIGEALMTTGSNRLRDSGVPALEKIANLVKSPLTAEGEDSGYLPISRQKRTEILNRLGDSLQQLGLTEEQYGNVLFQLQTGTRGLDATERVAAATIKKVLKDVRQYMRDAGVDVGDRGQEYFPRVWDVDAISKDIPGFRKMLQRYADAGEDVNPDAIINHLLSNDGNEFGQVLIRPGSQFAKGRVLHFIEGGDAEPWLSKNLLRTLDSYVSQATRRAEFSRRFGDKGQVLGQLIEQAVEEGATPEQIKTARTYLEGVGGTLGDTMDPTVRKWFGNAIVYQNIRLLPLAIFSQFIDPLGIGMRGGTVQNVFKAYARAIKEIPAGLKGVGGQDHMTQIAKDLNVIENAALSHAIGSLYNQGNATGTARKINDLFFRYNLMEQSNTSVRVAATEAAMQFIQRHAGKPDTHSERWLAELGLKAEDIQLQSDGALKYSTDHGLTEVQAAKMRVAINRWVDGAVLRPDSADKPIWMNDPHYMLMAHMKQFVFSFHETIIKRMLHEAKYGNMKPALVLASFVPVMIAADLAKGMLTGGGELPEHQKGWGLDDWIGHGIGRAGLLGVGQFAVDAGSYGLAGLGGPTVEQLWRGAEVIGSDAQFAPFLVKSMPANALYRGALT